MTMNNRYSRENHVRIFGLPENSPNTENVRLLVLDFIKDRLNIPRTLSDIDGAQRVGMMLYDTTMYEKTDHNKDRQTISLIRKLISKTEFS